MLTPVQSQTLAALFAPDQVVTDPVRLITYELDAGVLAGAPDGVVLPLTTEDVQRLVRWAREHGVALTARGSGTGYTGGAVTPEGGVVVSFARMNAILEVDEASRQATVQSGVINDDLNGRLRPLNLVYHPDPSSQSVCTLGGTISQNAGGPHCLKYGVTSNYVLGMEVVLADGRRVRLGGRALDPPEYDFVGLTTGSEGTLAMITEATLRLCRPPKGVRALTATFESVAVAGQAVSAVITAGLLPATIELMDGNMIALVEDYLQAGFPKGAGAMLIMDVDGYPASLDAQVDEIVEVLNRFTPLEIKVARTAEERELLWLGRRSAGPAHARISPNEYALDVSVPLSRLADALIAITQISDRHGLSVTFLGHAGDGNLHPTLLCDLSKLGELERVHRTAGEILELCAQMGGSIGGEHGLGVEKRDYLPAMYAPPEIAAMLEVKEVFDSGELLNLGKIFPADFQPPAPDPWQAGPVSGSPFAPASAVEAAEGLRALQAGGQRKFIAGGQTKWRGDAPKGTVLSTAGLSGVVSLTADDLYVTVRAGTPFDELQAVLAGQGFWVPLANPWPGATVGGVIASNANSPLRVLYGGIRDYVLAVQVALADGRLLRFGRPLVKDVAGYDMSKLFIGSYGTLGLLTEVTLKLMPLPRVRRSLVTVVPDLSQGLAWAFEALCHATLCSGLVITPDPVENLGLGGQSLVFTVEGHPADVAAEIRVVRDVLAAAGAEGLVETEEINATGHWTRILAKGNLIARAAVPPRDLSDFLSRLEPSILANPFVVDVAGGMLAVTGRDSSAAEAETLLSALRAGARNHGGYAVMSAGPRAWLHQLDAWGDPRESFDLMCALKARWDPAGILNSGEFAVG